MVRMHTWSIYISQNWSLDNTFGCTKKARWDNFSYCTLTSVWKTLLSNHPMTSSDCLNVFFFVCLFFCDTSFCFNVIRNHTIDVFVCNKGTNCIGEEMQRATQSCLFAFLSLNKIIDCFQDCCSCIVLF